MKSSGSNKIILDRFSFSERWFQLHLFSMSNQYLISIKKNEPELLKPEHSKSKMRDINITRKPGF